LTAQAILLHCGIRNRFEYILDDRAPDVWQFYGAAETGCEKSG